MKTAGGEIEYLSRPERENCFLGVRAMFFFFFFFLGGGWCD